MPTSASASASALSLLLPVCVCVCVCVHVCVPSPSAVLWAGKGRAGEKRRIRTPLRCCQAWPLRPRLRFYLIIDYLQTRKMRKSYAFTLISSILAVSVSSFQLGLKPVSQINRKLALLSSTDSNNFLDVNAAISIDATLPSSDVDSFISLSDLPSVTPMDTATNLSNPAEPNLTSESEALEIPQQDNQMPDSSIDTLDSGEGPQAAVPVVIKDLKLAALGPAYPDDTSYMMCSGCKAGDYRQNLAVHHGGVCNIRLIPTPAIDF